MNSSGLRREFIDKHIIEWERRLGEIQYYNHRRHWPSRLFHHAPLENAVSILKSGHLLPRNASMNSRGRDIAAIGIIDVSHRAHDFARLYFRPRTPTQYRVEGIQKLSDLIYSQNAHAPILYMFVFDAREILSIPGVHFSDMNMQTGVVEGSSEDYFTTIPFDKVFHEGGIGGDTSITKHRCAEVLAPSPLYLSSTLNSIYCRSDAERLTLLKCTGAMSPRLSKLIRVSDDLKVFQKRFTFAESVSLTNAGLVFRLNPRNDRGKISVKATVKNYHGDYVIDFLNQEMDAKPPNALAWRIDAKLTTGIYLVVIELDGHLAFRANLVIDSNPF